MAGGFFGVHTIDKGICSSFTRFFRRKALIFDGKAALEVLYLQFLPCAFISLIFLSACFLSWVCVLHGLCKVGMAQTYVCFWVVI